MNMHTHVHDTHQHTHTHAHKRFKHPCPPQAAELLLQRSACINQGRLFRRGACEQELVSLGSPSTSWRDREIEAQRSNETCSRTHRRREKRRLARTQDSGPHLTISPKCQVGPGTAGKREPGEKLPARVWNPFARPAMFSQGEVGGPGLPPP